MDHQREQVEALQQVTSSTSEFSRAKSQDQLISLPTGDGMALVFFGNAEAPVRCAIELTQKLASNPELKLRMGLHTGPVYRIADVNANRDVSGGGINIAQRVMDCGDAGHILVSTALASVLKQVSAWSGALHDLGEVQVKHGVRVHVFNLLQDGVGNADTPAAVSRQRQVDGDRTNFGGDKARRQYRIGFGLGAATVAALLVATGFGIVRYRRRNNATPFSESAKLRSGRFASRPAVALLGFKNLSGRSDAAWISPALSQMLGSQLSAGEQLLITPSEEVTHGKIDLALPGEQALGRETLSRVRDNLGSDYVVLGSFLDLDGQVRVDLSVQDTAKGETIYSISDAGPDNKLPDVAVRVGERLRQKLGVAEASLLDAASAKAAQSASLARETRAGAASLCSSKVEIACGSPSSVTWKSSLRRPPTDRPAIPGGHHDIDQHELHLRLDSRSLAARAGHGSLSLRVSHRTSKQQEPQKHTHGSTRRNHVEPPYSLRRHFAYQWFLRWGADAGRRRRLANRLDS